MSAILIWDIVHGSEYQPIGAAQLSIKIVAYDWNKSFHCDGLSSVIVVVAAEDRLKSSNSSYKQQMRKSCMCLSVFCLLYTPVEILRGVGCFLMAYGDVVSNERERGKRLFINGHFS